MTPEHERVIIDVYSENDCPREKIAGDLRNIYGFYSEVLRRIQPARYTWAEVYEVLVHTQKHAAETGGLPYVGRSHNGPLFRARSEPSLVME